MSAAGKDFYEKVFELVRQIPPGKVTTYGIIAEHAGMRSSARTVGWALNSARNDLSIPYHRVVNRNGMLTGARHFATPTLMRELLESEGVKFEGDAVIMAGHLWRPGEDDSMPRGPVAAKENS